MKSLSEREVVPVQGHLPVIEVDPIDPEHSHSQFFPLPHWDETDIKMMHEEEAENKRLTGKWRSLKELN